MNYELEVTQHRPVVFDTLNQGEVNRNLVWNPLPSNDVGVFFQVAQGVGAGTTSVVNSGGPFGSSFVRRTITASGTAATAPRDFMTYGGTWSDYAGIPGPAVVPGETYTGSMYVRSSKAVRLVFEAIFIKTPYSGTNGVSNGGQSTATNAYNIPANTWVRVNATLKATTDAQTLRLDLDDVTGNVWNVGDTVDVACFMITEGSKLYNYADGSSANWLWTGPANNSPSIQMASRPPLVSGSGSSAPVSRNIDYSSQVFNSGRESIPFSLEVWFYPLTNTNELVVVGHGTEGVLWDGSKFILRIKQGDGTIISQSTWTPPEIKAFHIVMTYAPGVALLYVDGELVTSVELPADNFFAVNQPVSINRGTGSGVYDSFALYTRALTSREIAQHYNWGNEVPDSTTIAMSKGATTWDLTYTNVDLAKSFVYDEANFAESSYMDNVNIEDGKIIANEGGGEWRQSMVVSALIGTTSAGVHVTHESAGASFSYSLDGETWIPVTNKTTILEDVTIEVDAILYFRLQLTDENSWVKSLILDVLASRIMRPIAGKRNLTFKSVAFDQTPGNQLDYHRDAGAVINTGGYLTIGLDETENPTSVKTIQFWAKFDGAAVLFNSDNRVAVVKADGLIGYNTGALEIYANGSYVASDQTSIRFNEWNFFSVRLTSADNKTITVGAPGATIYGLATYPNIPAETYGFNVGAPALRVNDTSSLTWTETSPATKIHAYNWSYIAGATP